MLLRADTSSLDMPITTLRRNGIGDRSILTTILALCFKFRFYFLFCGSFAAFFLVFIYPHEWASVAKSRTSDSRVLTHVDTKKAESVKEVMKDFKFDTIETKWTASGRKVKRIQVVDKVNPNIPLSYGQAIELLQTNAEFRDDFFDQLQRGMQAFSDGDINSYFFETPAVTHETKHDLKFEFVLVAAPELNEVIANPSAFEQYFPKCDNRVTVFSNLGGDATLVVPCRPEKYESLDTFATLANFMRTGSNTHMHDFWITVGRQMEKRLKENPREKIWMSTCGTGIYWLHLRLDTRPKYYTYEPYRTD